MREDLQKVKTQWEKKVEEVEREEERKRVEQMCKNNLHIGNLQVEYKNLLESKIQQITMDSQIENTKLKKDHSDLKQSFSQKMAAIEKEYIKIQKHEEILNR